MIERLWNRWRGNAGHRDNGLAPTRLFGHRGPSRGVDPWNQRRREASMQATSFGSRVVENWDPPRYQVRPGGTAWASPPGRIMYGILDPGNAGSQAGTIGPGRPLPWFRPWSQLASPARGIYSQFGGHAHGRYLQLIRQGEWEAVHGRPRVTEQHVIATPYSPLVSGRNYGTGYSASGTGTQPPMG